MRQGIYCSFEDPCGLSLCPLHPVYSFLCRVPEICCWCGVVSHISSASSHNLYRLNGLPLHPLIAFHAKFKLSSDSEQRTNGTWPRALSIELFLILLNPNIFRFVSLTVNLDFCCVCNMFNAAVDVHIKEILDLRTQDLSWPFPQISPQEP